MTSATFEELQSQIQASYQAGDYTAALEFAAKNAARFPEQAALIDYWRISMLARLEKPDDAIQLLEDALASGIWYSEVLLRKSPSLQSLQDSPEFEAVLDRNRQVQEQDQAQLYPLITLRPQGDCQKGDIPCPLLIGLHANVSTAQASIDYWKPAGGAGWLVAVPQSSQAMYKDAYVWDDLQVTKEEIQRHYAVLGEQYAIDPEQVILAGHAMGAEVAIWLALSGAIEVSGFVAINPTGPLMDEVDNWQPLIEKSAGIPLSGAIIIGEDDHTTSPSSIRSLVEMLNRGGIPCELEVIPGVGQDYHPEYETSLVRGIDYIIERI